MKGEDMADFEFEVECEVAIIGAGLAGLACAKTLCDNGVDPEGIFVIERGNQSGAKNVSGGRLYTHNLAKVFPNYEEAPLQRKVVRERISLLAADSAMSLDVTDEAFKKNGQESYTVLRGTFDPWLQEQVENLGVMIMPTFPAIDFCRDEAGKIIGVACASGEFDDEGNDIPTYIGAKVVVIADGANSLMLKKSGLDNKPAPKPEHMAVGAKEILQLDAKTIEDRFQLNPGEGCAWMFAGDPSDGKFGGVALYTYEDTISIALVAGIEAIAEGDTPIYQMLENFKNRSDIAPLLKGAEIVEYSGHMVPEGGANMTPQLVGDNVILTGDAAGFCVNVGYTVRGMDFAIESGYLAGVAVAKALEAGDTSKAGLASYEQAVKASFIQKDMDVCKNFAPAVEHSRVFTEYPGFIGKVFRSLYVFDGTPQIPIMKKLMPIVKEMGMIKTAKEVLKLVRSL